MFWAGLVFVTGLIFILHAQDAAIQTAAPLQIEPLQLTATDIGKFSLLSDKDLAALLEILGESPTIEPEDLPAVSGGWWSLQNPSWPPLPGNIKSAAAWPLKNGAFLLNDLTVDYTARSKKSGGGMQTMDEDEGPPAPPGGGGGDYTNDWTLPPLDTNGLWLNITNVSGGLAYLNLMNATDSVYEVMSKHDLLATNWNIEGELWPVGGQTNVMPFTVAASSPTNLFIWAMDWTRVDANSNGVPDWWEWHYFGNFNQASNTDYDGDGFDIYDEYWEGYDPNKIQFSLQFTNDHVSSSPANGALTVLGGVPAYIAVLVNDTNHAHAVWQPYTSTNVAVSMTTNGLYNVLVGLRGLPADAQQTWLGTWLTLNTVSPAFTIISPTNGTVSVPLIQLQGYVSETLGSLTYDVSNATGIFTNQQGYWQPVFFNTNLMDYTTNGFQCYDVKLATGLNRITLHATDLAGNTAMLTTNITLSYTGVTNKPALTVLWPQNNASIGGNNVTIQAQMNDATAGITATVNGSTVAGLVERSGRVWFNDLPLNGGTNVVTLIATSAAGNMSTNSLNVVKSSVNLTIDPIADTDLNQTNVTVTGTISSSGYNVWVNGVAASVVGTGWEADGVPVSPVGTAVLQVTAGASATNLVASQTLYQPQPARVSLMSYAGGHHLPNFGLEDETIHWDYQQGGSYSSGSESPFQISSNQNGVAYAFMSPHTVPFVVPWENASMTAAQLTDSDYPEGSPYGNRTQARVMIEPGGQALPGTSQTYLVLVNASEFSEGQIYWGAVYYGFGFSYDRMVNLPGLPESYAGDSPLAPEWLQVNGQALVNSGITNADGSVSGALLVSGPAGAPLPLTVTATQVHQYQDFTFDAKPQEVHLALIGAHSGYDFTDETNPVIVGEQIALVAQLSVTNQIMTNWPVSNFQWTVPGYAISNFVADGNSGIVYSNFPTTRSNVFFYWVDGGSNRVVQCSVTVNGVKITSKTTLDVVRPTVTVTSRTGTIAADTNYTQINLDGSTNGNVFALHYGNPVGTPGIVVSNANGTVTLPNLSSSFVLEWVQLVNSATNQAQRTDGTWHVTVQVTNSMLDTSYPANTNLYATDDSPAQTLTTPSNFQAISVSQNFSTWLMFKPVSFLSNSIPNACYVPLRVVNWGWSAYADSYATNGPLTSSNNIVNPSGVDSFNYPQWTDNATNHVFQP